MIRRPRLGVLAGYLVRQNLFLMLICLGAGTFIYLLSDFADRMNQFLNAGLGWKHMATYFAVKMPLIISQIMPAVFLLGVVLQIGLLVRSREMIALRAGGVSPGWFLKFFVCYALAWSLGQLLFSQFIATYGEQEASRIWREEVRKKQLDQRVVKHVWFREGPYIVHAGEAQPSQSRVKDVTLYEFDRDTMRLMRIMTAKRGLVDEHGWGLLDVWEIETKDFSAVKQLTDFIPVQQNLKTFLNPEIADRAELPLWHLGRLIEELRESGSNVERLRTAWHGKWSYAFSIVAMALLALAMCSLFENMYLNIVLSLLVVFAYYGLYVIGITTGQKGLVPPIVGAWMANGVFSFLALSRLGWVSGSAAALKVRRWRQNIMRRRTPEQGG